MKVQQLHKSFPVKSDVAHLTGRYSLRPRASSSSSQSERSASPLVISSTHSLETMPRFALSTDDEGELCLAFGDGVHVFNLLFLQKQRWEVTQYKHLHVIDFSVSLVKYFFFS